MSAAMMTNHRDLEEIARRRTNRVHQNMQPHQMTGAIQSFHMKPSAPHKQKIGDKLHNLKKESVQAEDAEKSAEWACDKHITNTLQRTTNTQEVHN